MDEKQWLVSRLDVVHKTIFDEFQLSKDEFIRIREGRTSSILSKRNAILSSVAFVLAILIGLHEFGVGNDHLDIYIYVLSIDVIVGASTFLVAFTFVRSNESAFINIENSITHVQESLNHNFGFLLHNTTELNDISIATLREYGIFLRVLAGIVYIPFTIALVQNSKSRLLDSYYKKIFTEPLHEHIQVIEQAITLFNNMNKQNLPSVSLKYVADTIASYKK